MARTDNAGVGKRVWVGAGLIATVTGAWFLWSQANRVEPAAIAASESSFVRIARDGGGAGERLLAERADLLDPAPLFIPTEKNFGQGPLPEAVLRQPGQVFDDFGAKLNTAESGLRSYGADAAGAPGELTEILTRANEVPFSGFGQVGGSGLHVVDRKHSIVIHPLANDGDVISLDWKEGEPPQKEFAPTEFVVLIGEAGLIGEPLLTVGSGREEVDAALRAYLSVDSRLNTRLSPGRYVVVVGP